MRKILKLNEGWQFIKDCADPNATEGAEIKVNCEREWVRNIAVEDGVIAFDVDASYEEKERSCRLELIYPGV